MNPSVDEPLHDVSAMQEAIHGFVSPQNTQTATLDPINESNFQLRKGSLNLRTQRKAVALYNAPVV